MDDKVLSGPRRPAACGKPGRLGVDRAWTVPVRFAHHAPRRRRRPPGRKPLPADRGLRVPLGLRGLRARGAERQRRVDVPAALRRPVDLRHDARPRRRRPSGSRRSTPRCPPASATCRARWCWRRPGARARAGSSSATCCSSGPGTTTTSARTRTGARRPTTTPTTSCCARCAASTGASRCTWSASRASTTGARRVAWEYAGAGYGKAVGARRGRGPSS